MNSKAPGYSFQVEMLISIFKRNPLVSEFKVLQKYYKGLRVTKCWAFPWNNQIKSASKLFKGFWLFSHSTWVRIQILSPHSMHTDFLPTQQTTMAKLKPFQKKAN